MRILCMRRIRLTNRVCSDCFGPWFMRESTCGVWLELGVSACEKLRVVSIVKVVLVCSDASILLVSEYLSWPPEIA